MHVGDDPSKFNSVCCKPKQGYTCEEMRSQGKNCRLGFEFHASPIGRDKKPVRYLWEYFKSACCTAMGSN